jgi:hypothetical protein
MSNRGWWSLGDTAATISPQVERDTELIDPHQVPSTARTPSLRHSLLVEQLAQAPDCVKSSSG